MVELPKTIGTVGAGNMAEAILRGLLHAGLAPEQLMAADPDTGRCEYLAAELGVRTTSSNAELAQASELVVLAIKPDKLETAAASLPHDGGPLYVSIVAGAPLAKLRRLLGAGARVARTMPNTPALIRAGITALADDPAAAPDDLERAEAVLRAVGEVVRVPEGLLDAVTGLSGSGPAYVYLFIESLVDAGVREGLPAATARRLAVETVVGAARMVQGSEDHPAVLRERVSSPGGTTIAGLAALERAGFRSGVHEAVRAATARSRELAGS